MLATFLIAGLLVLITSLWVGWDATRIGARRGLLKGMCDLSAGQWCWACVLLWGPMFTLYLATRPRIKKAASDKPRLSARAKHRGFVGMLAAALTLAFAWLLLLVSAPGPLVIEGAELLKSGDAASAEKCFRTAMRIDEQLYGDTHFYTNNSRSWLGEALTKLGRYDEAEPLLLKALPNIDQSPQAGDFHISRAHARIQELRAAKAAKSP